MAKFKISVRYENFSCEEVIEIEAKTLGEVKRKCEEIKQENLNLIEVYKSKNIYTTRIIKECYILNYNWQDELLGCIGFDK